MKHVAKIIEIVGSSDKSWEDAAPIKEWATDGAVLITTSK